METEYLSIDTVPSKKVLSAHIIRSPLPRGKMKSILFPPLPEGYYSITYKDIPGINSISVFKDSMPLLCEEDVMYKGEPLAVICGPDRKKVLELSAGTKIEIETDYTLMGFINYSREQIAGKKTFSKGNTEKIFSETYRIVEGEYHIAPRKARFTSYQGVIASYSKDTMEIQTETQWPFHLRKTISEICRIPVSRVNITIGKFSPTYDEKLVLPSIYASLAALLSLKSGKTVRFTPSKEEMTEYFSRKPQVRVTRKSAVDDKGKIMAEEAEICVNLGAYPLFTEEILTQIAIGAAGSYTIPNMKITCTGIKTSEPPMNAFKGLSLSSGAFSAETHVSRTAEIFKENPGEWRFKYIPGKKAYIPTGGIERNFTGRELLEKILAESDFNRKYSAYEVLKRHRRHGRSSMDLMRGIGISFGFSGNGFTSRKNINESYAVRVKLDTDDRVTIYSSANGAPATNIWKETAAAVLGIDPGSVIIRRGNTSTLPNSGPSFLSSDISIITSLVEKCCLSIKKQRFHQALPIEIKKSYRTSGNRKWDSERMKGMPFHSLTWGSTVVEVEIDPVFLRPVVRGVWIIADSGRVYNSKKAVTALETAVLETIDWVLENDDITVSPVTETGFNTPFRRKLPDIYAEIMENRRTVTGGISRLPDTLIPSALTSAVSQATGIYFDKLPITPNLLYRYAEET